MKKYTAVYRNGGTVNSPGDVVPHGPRRGFLYARTVDLGSATLVVYRDATQYHTWYWSLFRSPGANYAAVEDDWTPCRTPDDAIRAGLACAVA